MIISARAEQIGTSKASAAAEITGSDLEVSFNAKFIFDGMSALKKGKINFDFSGNLSPAKLYLEDSKDYFYIIMPLRTEE